MDEAHYHPQALIFVTDLTNAPPRSADELTDRWKRSALATPATPDATTDDLIDTLRFLRQWAAVVDAKSEQQRVDVLNALLAAAAAYPRITNHDNSGWHLHYRDDGIPLAGIIRATTAIAAAEHLTHYGMDRVGRCALAECTNAYVDASRNGFQRYCTRTCANRDAVRRHRAKAAAQT